MIHLIMKYSELNHFYATKDLRFYHTYDKQAFGSMMKKINSSAKNSADLECA